MADTTVSAPQNVEAEESVLGACLLSGDAAADRASELLAPRDFYRDSHGLIFSAVLALRRRGEPSEPLLVIRELERGGELEHAGGRGRIHELYASVSATSNVGHHAHLVLEAARNRQLHKAATAMSTAALNGGLTLHPELLDEMRAAILESEGLGQPERVLPPIVSARELCARPDPENGGELLGPLLQRGNRTIIGADTGQGKTTFVIAMISAVVRSSPWLHWQGAGGVALLIDLEQSEQSAKRRLREAGLGESEDVDVWLVPDGLALESNRQQRLIIDRALQGSGYDIVAIDPHYKAHSGDSKEERDVLALMRVLDNWRYEHDFALMLPTHARKPPTQGREKLTIHDIAAGSGAIVRGAEIVIGLEITGPGLTKLYFFKHRDGSDELPGDGNAGESWSLAFGREHGYRLVDTSTGPRKARPEDIAAYVRHCGGRCSPGELRVEFDLSDAALRDRRPLLAALGIEYRREGRDSLYVAGETTLAPDEVPEFTPPGAYDEPGCDHGEA